MKIKAGIFWFSVSGKPGPDVDLMTSITRVLPAHSKKARIEMSLLIQIPLAQFTGGEKY